VLSGLAKNSRVAGWLLNVPSNAFSATDIASARDMVGVGDAIVAIFVLGRKPFEVKY
jgi:hypothetical protein